jgi:hypothetical protein
MFSLSGTVIQFEQNPRNLRRSPRQIDTENAVAYGAHTCLIAQISGSPSSLYVPGFRFR